MLPCALHYFTFPAAGDRDSEGRGPIVQDEPKRWPNSLKKETGTHHTNSLPNDIIPAPTPERTEGGNGPLHRHLIPASFIPFMLPAVSPNHLFSASLFLPNKNRPRSGTFCCGQALHPPYTLWAKEPSLK